MIRKFALKYFFNNGKILTENGSYLTDGKNKFKIRNDIPRFSPDYSYSSGNFSRLREKHATLQLDSRNHTSDRLNTILNRTRWPKDYFKNKTILECGCGAGPDTEILLGLGAKVISVDIAGLDIARQNMSDNSNFANVQFVQDSITDLHFRPGSFDVVFCHRVLQHTPDPEQTLDHILKFVKKDGDVFVHSYSNSRFQTWRWKYALLPITNKLPPAFLYGVIKVYAWPAFWFTNATNHFALGRKFNHVVVPFLNYRSSPKFNGKSNKFIVEYGVHDTFDALSPRYDHPIKPETMDTIAKKYITKDYEIYKDTGMTLLRTKVKK